ncbi:MULTISPECIES: DEAD/DEAH box helicase [unclassified Planococcus (in: firmicutes)]|uniref:DEAD/DEAH box helicase n=1 Tax=unclassified Planococcus (in: firmicutes) TaxID=2662419 RepID=UPI000C34C4D5|nr:MULTISPECIES: DEAD/DEAH box helicase [unclassified Planococcus (in: firmicutes)]AUD12974.1 DEAD/DEAH box helicase [Planococcus sp. MB-3u-03]PKG47599.1 DEAD/DEAH box helicase [Planococcus sp. Urea-trap-24]PKG88078.1 DEAD/DEAH box helicase [Planococcus sp. Urea-3u-39]PKH36999.1 DEAD/DEAH box helicase [Planococcus sp. MB-3u-09]
MVKFTELNISETTLKSVRRMGFEEATPIQEGTIRLGMEGKDIIGQAQTGTGKTTAFGIPLIEKIDTRDGNVQGLVIAPTRELAIQVSEELYNLGKDKNVRILSVFGGQEIGRQIRALKNRPQIIVGTPGRLLDHINRRTLKLENVNTLVLDEADEMLNMGFIEDIQSIMSNVPETRQTLLFSATMPDPIRRIAEKFMKTPEIVKIKSKEMTVENIEQFYVKSVEREKFDILSRLLNVQQPELAIVFGRTKRRVDELAKALNLRGYLAEGIHGDLSQAKRMSVLKQFKANKIDILVATDVAARGLDISGVSHVYNFDIPQDPESYVHRIGRTGRAGKKGVAVTFVTPREMGYLSIVERTTKKKMEALVPPTADEAVIGLQRVAMEQLETMTEKNNLGSYRELATEMLDKHDAVDLIAAALKTLTKDPEDAPVQITEERPLPSRGGGGYKGKGGGRSSGGGYKGKGGGGRPSSGGYKGRRESSSSSRPSGGGRPGRTRRHES